MKQNTPSTDTAEAPISREELLQLPDEEKLAYFEERVVVQHPNMKIALEDVLTLSAPRSGTDVILLIGPTGIGKSATIKATRKQLIRRHYAEMQRNPAFIPIVIVEAPSVGEQRFSWRILYNRMGEELNEPLLNKKAVTVVSDDGWSFPVGRNSTVAALRASVEKGLKHRSTQLLVIDEAVHVLDGCATDKLNIHMNALKSISNLADVTLCLAGSYDLYQLLKLSGQVARRTAVVHMPRYLVGKLEDEKMFRKVVLTLQNHLPLVVTPDLARLSVTLQKSCVGCVGILKDSLQRALATTLERGGVWKDEYLAKALLSETAVSQILEETLTGEREVARAVYGSRSLDALRIA